MTRHPAGDQHVPVWLWLFAYALMGSGFAINAVFIALAVPAITPFGYGGLMAAAVIGAVIGVLPARWLARRIHEGIREDA